jgi:hypothetical protein
MEEDRSAGEAFLAASARDIRPFLGGTICYQLLGELATGRQSLLTVEPGPDPARAHAWRLRLTSDGRRVLRGEAEALVHGNVRP